MFSDNQEPSLFEGNNRANGVDIKTTDPEYLNLSKSKHSSDFNSDNYIIEDIVEKDDCKAEKALNEVTNCNGNAKDLELGDLSSQIWELTEFSQMMPTIKMPTSDMDTDVQSDNPDNSVEALENSEQKSDRDCAFPDKIHNNSFSLTFDQPSAPNYENDLNDKDFENELENLLSINKGKTSSLKSRPPFKVPFKNKPANLVQQPNVRYSLKSEMGSVDGSIKPSSSTDMPHEISFEKLAVPNAINPKRSDNLSVECSVKSENLKANNGAKVSSEENLKGTPSVSTGTHFPKLTNNTDVHSDADNSRFQEFNLCQGFNTASCKTINISEKAKVKATKLLACLDDENIQNTHSSLNLLPNENYSVSVMNTVDLNSKNNICKIVRNKVGIQEKNLDHRNPGFKPFKPPKLSKKNIKTAAENSKNQEKSASVDLENDDCVSTKITSARVESDMDFELSSKPSSNSEKLTCEDKSMMKENVEEIKKIITVQDGNNTVDQTLEHFGVKTLNEEIVENPKSHSRLSLHKRAGRCPSENPSNQFTNFSGKGNNDFSSVTHVSKYQGFSTASGAQIMVTEGSLKQAKGLFDNEAIDFQNGTSISSVSQDSSALIKEDIQASKDDLTFNLRDKDVFHYEKLCETAPVSKAHISNNLFPHEALMKAHGTNSTATDHNQDISSHFSGFSTASGAKLKASENTFNMQKIIFENDKNNSGHCNQDFQNFTELSTSLGLKGTVSEKPLLRISNSLLDKENVEDNHASGLKVLVSESALKHAKSVFEDECMGADNESIEINKSTTCYGVSTASDTSVIVSEISITHAKSLFDEENNFIRETCKGTKPNFSSFSGFKVDVVEYPPTFAKSLDEDKGNSIDEASSNEAGNTYHGFTTASGSKVSVTENSLTHAKSFFDEDVNNFIAPGKTNFSGFISGSKVQASEDAMKHADKGKSDDNSNIKGNPTDESTHFPGFITALGSKVQVSNNSLKNAKLFFDKENSKINVKENCEMETITNFPGFATASGSKVQVSEDSLKHAKSFFDEEKGKGSVKENHKLGATNFPGFATALGSKVRVYENSLIQTKSFFDENRTNNEEEHRKMTAKNCPGFATASRSKVQTSKKALNNAVTFFDKRKSIQEEHCEVSTVKFPGFATALGSKVEVSEQSLKHAKSIFVEEESTCAAKEDPNKTMASNYPGFATASGSKVQVSENALKHAKSIFLEEESTDIVEENRNKTIGSDTPVFPTASGFEVQVSETSLKHSKSIFIEDAKNKQDTEITLDTPSRHNSKGPGFTTASESMVTVLENSLKHSKSLFESEGDQNLTKRVDLNSSTVSNFPGFSTASGINVNVSETTLKHAKTWLDEDDNERKDNPNITYSTIFPGFATASGLKLTLSDDSLKHAQTFLEEQDHNGTNSTIKTQQLLPEEASRNIKHLSDPHSFLMTTRSKSRSAVERKNVLQKDWPTGTNSAMSNSALLGIEYDRKRAASKMRMGMGMYSYSAFII